MNISRRLSAIAIGLLVILPLQASVYSMRELAEKMPDPELRAQSAELQGIFDTLAQHSGVDADLYYSPSPDINAFATDVGDRKIVIIEQGLVELIDADRDAVAATIGHELAHHKADHIQAGRRKKEGARVFGAILGAVVGAKIGARNGAAAGALGGAAVGVGTGLLVLKFNRNQEMQADRLSVQWLVETGFNPQGMLRLQKRLSSLDPKKRKSSILSTHPTSSKRYASAEKLIASNPPAADVLARPATPLVGPETLARASEARKASDNERIASLLVPLQAPSAAMVAPVEKLPFERFVQLSNEIAHADPGAEAGLLKQNQLTADRWKKLHKEFERRAELERSVATHYAMLYRRASLGPFAAYGRDLADSWQLGHALKLDPPYDLATAVAVQSALRPYQGRTIDAALRRQLDGEILLPFKLRYYDAEIGQAWWKRNAQIAALDGDGQAEQQLMAAAQASE